jgi:hypothetical protein
MSNDNEAAEYRRRTDEAIERLSLESNPGARDHWKRLALEYSRLVDLIAMREGLGLKLAVNMRNVRSVSEVTDLDMLETAADDWPLAAGVEAHNA